MKKLYTGVNGRKVALDLSKVEAILDEDDGRVDLFSSADWYKILADFDEVYKDWSQAR
jgi:hypothetical protein